MVGCRHPISKLSSSVILISSLVTLLMWTVCRFAKLAGKGKVPLLDIEVELN